MKNIFNSFKNVIVIAFAIIITFAGVIGAIHKLQCFIHKEVKNILNDPVILAKIRPFMIVDSNGTILLESGTQDIINKNITIERKADNLKMVIKPNRVLQIAPIVTPDKDFLPFYPDKTITGKPGTGYNWKYNMKIPSNDYCRFRIDVIY